MMVLLNIWAALVTNTKFDCRNIEREEWTNYCR